MGNSCDRPSVRRAEHKAVLAAAVLLHETDVYRGWRRCNATTVACMISAGDVETWIPVYYLEELFEECPFFAMKMSDGVYDARQHHYGDVVKMAQQLHFVKTGCKIRGSESNLFSDLFKSGGLHLLNVAHSREEE